MIKKLLIVLVAALVVLSSQTASFAFLYEMKTLTRDEIVKMTDEQLVDAYLDCIVEIEATKTFHETSGFTTIKDFNSYKALLKYRLLLQMEMQNRNLTAPGM